MEPKIINADPSVAYKRVRSVGKWATVILWIQVIVLPLVSFSPYIQNHNISASHFIADGIINVGLEIGLVALLLIFGEPLKHPENILVKQVQRNATILGVTVVVVAVIGLLTGGRSGIIWLLFLYATTRAIKVSKAANKAGQQYINR